MIKGLLLVVGKAKQAWVRDGQAHFEKLLSGMMQLEVREVAEGQYKKGMEERTLTSETEALLAQIPEGARVFLCVDEGKAYSSEQFASKIEEETQGGAQIVFVIGGAYGVKRELFMERGASLLTLSSMVLSHQLVRLVLLEQLYRARSITLGREYHHGEKF